VRFRFGWSAGVVFGVLAMALGGCGSVSGGVRSDALALAAPAATLAEPDVSPRPVFSTGVTTTAPAATVGAADLFGPEPDPGALVAEPPDTPVEPAVAAASADALAEPGAADDVASIASEVPSNPLTDTSVLSLVDTTLVAQAGGSSEARADDVIEEYDPLEKFNEAMFEFNLKVDRYVLKPVAKAYDFVMPDELQQMISRAFANLNFVPRFVNNLLQAKWAGAGREASRFLINTVVGIGGLWDIAKVEFNIDASRADFGQTLGKWGTPPGPYLVLPFLPPLTFRDGIGYAVDGAMDPLSYVLPFIWERLVMKIVDTVNDRSLNLDLFQGFEETTVDFYSAVRNAYLQRRYRLIHGE
jgi:phospholipid-binding lipoprotein MlaA